MPYNLIILFSCKYQDDIRIKTITSLFFVTSIEFISIMQRIRRNSLRYPSSIIMKARILGNMLYILPPRNDRGNIESIPLPWDFSFHTFFKWNNARSIPPMERELGRTKRLYRDEGSGISRAASPGVVPWKQRTSYFPLMSPTAPLDSTNARFSGTRPWFIAVVIPTGVCSYLIWIFIIGTIADSLWHFNDALGGTVS